MSKDSKATYYDAGGVETIDVIKAKLTQEQYEGYLLGNLIKYSCRANHKGAFQRDIEKIVTYSKELSDLKPKEEMPIKRITPKQRIERNHKIVIALCEDGLLMSDIALKYNLSPSATVAAFKAAYKILDITIKDTTAGKKMFDMYKSQWKKYSQNK